LQLTFRQVCTADQTDKVEFLEVNQCITSEDNFGLATKHFANAHRKEGTLLPVNYTNVSIKSMFSEVK